MDFALEKPQRASISIPTGYTAPESTSPRCKPFREPLRAALSEYKNKHTLSNAQLARELGIDPTGVSKYLNKKPEGDIDQLEARVQDVLKAAPKRREVTAELFQTSVTRSVAARLEIIRKTNDFGLLTGHAGIGKSCAVDLYAAANAASILVRLSRWSAHSGGLEAALFSQLETKAKERFIRRAEWMVDRLKGSNRLVIIDNAQRLTSGALDWLFDFHDATGCPIALVGNPDILTKIARVDQRFSRIGYAREVTLMKPEPAAMQLLEQLCPGDAEELKDLAVAVASQRGYLRALRKHVALMPELLQAAGGDASQAFRMAHTQLVNDYTLES